MGNAAFQLTVAPDGTVASVSTVHAHPVFAEAATTALKEWRFAPSGNAFKVDVTLYFEFYDEPCDRPLIPETQVYADLPSSVHIRTGLQCVAASNSQAKR